MGAAEEALAIGVYAAPAAEGDFACGVRNAGSTFRASDSTTPVAEKIVGAALGADAIPTE
jgi:hypothetical protein